MSRLFAYGPADASASQNPIISCLIWIQTGYLHDAMLVRVLAMALFVCLSQDSNVM